jgi:hypothetical protein
LLLIDFALLFGHLLVPCLTVALLHSVWGWRGWQLSLKKPATNGRLTL